MTSGKIIAFGLLTERDLQVLGPAFSRAWPVDEAPCFTQLLDAIDEADRSHSVRQNPASNLGANSGVTLLDNHPIGVGRR